MKLALFVSHVKMIEVVLYTFYYATKAVGVGVGFYQIEDKNK